MDIQNPSIFFPLLIFANLVAYVLNILISKLWNKVNGFKETIHKKEIADSLRIVLINIAIALPGYVLWYHGAITFSSTNPWMSFVGIFFLMDFLMYGLHFLSHNFRPLHTIHLKHHQHTNRFNSVSLYHMSPWESVFFGLLLTVVAFLFQFNLLGYILFLIFNWFYGVVTHLNNKKAPSSLFIFTTNAFHKAHHQRNNKNYGFYTFIWDKVFKTDVKKQTTN